MKLATFSAAVVAAVCALFVAAGAGVAGLTADVTGAIGQPVLLDDEQVHAVARVERWWGGGFWYVERGEVAVTVYVTIDAKAKTSHNSLYYGVRGPSGRTWGRVTLGSRAEPALERERACGHARRGMAHVRRPGVGGEQADARVSHARGLRLELLVPLGAPSPSPTATVGRPVTLEDSRSTRSRVPRSGPAQGCGKPKAGNVYVTVNVKVKALQSTAVGASYYSFRDRAGEVYRGSLLGKRTPALAYRTSLAAGRTAQGWITMMIPKTRVAGLTLTYHMLGARGRRSSCPCRSGDRAGGGRPSPAPVRLLDRTACPKRYVRRVRRAAGAPQGEAIAAWLVSALVLVAITVTYARLDPTELYNVSGEGVAGGLSRALVELNFPISLVAVAIVLVALDALPGRAWAIGGPAIALCAVTAWPGVVDQSDLDARAVNAVPAAGALLALGLTIAATRRAGHGVAPRLPFDPLRVAIAAASLLASIPWLAAEVGAFLPDGLFVMERLVPEADGSRLASVHLGHHHGLDGTLIVLSALLLSRPRIRDVGLSTATLAYVSLAFSYGAVNLAEDFWHEQVVKRGWVDWTIPSALEPGPRPVWLVILLLGALTGLALRSEAGRVDSPA